VLTTLHEIYLFHILCCVVTFVLAKAEPEKKVATPKAKAGKVASMCHVSKLALIFSVDEYSTKLSCVVSVAKA